MNYAEMTWDKLFDIWDEEYFTMIKNLKIYDESKDLNFLNQASKSLIEIENYKNETVISEEKANEQLKIYEVDDFISPIEYHIRF